MNTLTIIKNHIEKSARLHNAQIAHTSYRGIDYQCKQGEGETHGTFCYRGRTYIKWYNLLKFTERVKNPLFFCTYVKKKQMYTTIHKLL